MISKALLDFLSELQQNNNRDWFSENKTQFEKHQKAFKTFVQEINDAFAAHDSIEKMQIHRIYRDVRFSKDKTPYKNHLAASLDRGGSWTPLPGK